VAFLRARYLFAVPPVDSSAMGGTMIENPASKKGVKADPKEGLIVVPGRDEPQELLAPLRERIDPETNLPYQSVMSVNEMLAAEEQHKRCMAFVRDTMKARWKCLSCGNQLPGTQLRPSGDMLELLREMLQPGSKRIDWDSITEHLAKHLRCPECSGACFPLREDA
jgi:hypothetical protein